MTEIAVKRGLEDPTSVLFLEPFCEPPIGREAHLEDQSERPHPISSAPSLAEAPLLNPLQSTTAESAGRREPEAEVGVKVGVEQDVEATEKLKDKGKKSRSRRPRGKWRRRWKPYHSRERSGNQSWEEKGKRPARGPAEGDPDNEAKRAHWAKNRGQKAYAPQCKAPYNHNQFLMADHNVREPDFEEINKLLHHNHPHHHHHQHNGGSNDLEPGHRRRLDSETLEEGASSSDEYYSSPDDEQDFMQRQFSEAYENIHAERLNSMSKTELVQEYLLLEDRVEDLENKLKIASARETTPMELSHSESQLEPTSEARVSIVEEAKRIQDEVKRLHDENQRLRADNENLQRILGDRHGCHLTEMEESSHHEEEAEEEGDQPQPQPQGNHEKDKSSEKRALETLSSVSCEKVSSPRTQCDFDVQRKEKPEAVDGSTQ